MQKSKTGIKGVCLGKNNKYRVIFNRKSTGLFEDKIEAAKFWDEYAISKLGKENVTTNKDLGIY